MLFFVVEIASLPDMFYSFGFQALGLSSTNIAAGMAADNLAMAAYFAIIMSIPDKLEKESSETDGD